MRSRFLLEAVIKALCLDVVGSATVLDMGATLGLGMVDLSGLQLDFTRKRESSVSEFALC